jgi:parallel beta-helix repeat protein
VAPGSYPALAVQSSDLQGPVTLLADVTGATESVGAVTIDAGGHSVAAVSISGVSGLTIDGITAQGGTEEGILVVDSPDTTIRNCIAGNNRGDGVFVQSSDATLLFDNLSYGNTGAGIRIYSSNDVSVINNTIYGNRGAGIFIGTAADPSFGVVVENNIIDTNLGDGIEVRSGSDYMGDYNMNTDGYAPGTAGGVHDVIGSSGSPGFVAPSLEDFHLTPQADDCTGGSPAINAGDPATAEDLVAILTQRTTRSDGLVDCVGALCCTTLTADPTPQPVELQPGQVDLGYHYAAPLATPTPAPRNPTRTRTPTRTPTITPTGTATGTPAATATGSPVGSATSTPEETATMTATP